MPTAEGAEIEMILVTDMKQVGLDFCFSCLIKRLRGLSPIRANVNPLRPYSGLQCP